MDVAILFAIVAVGLAATMAAAWAIALKSGQSGWIDAIWSLGVGVFGVVASLAPLGADDWSPRQWLVAVLAGLWSLRLGLHIVSRTMQGGDDPRYAKLKEEWGGAFRARLFWFLQIQAAAGFLLVATIAAAAHNPAQGFGPGDWLGVAIMAVAVVGEGIADRQLARFRADPANKGKVCDVGLWGVSRHPNYFFEWLVWVAYVAIAVDLTGGYAWGWIALAGPAFMYWLLVHVSGIPPLEAHMLRSRGDRFRKYQAEVSAFWPWPRRRSGAALSRETIR